MHGHKGISIIVAIILVVAITLTLAVVLFSFVQTTQRTAQGQTQSETSQLFVRASSSLRIIDTPIIGADNTTKLVLRNTGFREIDIGENNLNIIVRVPSTGEACSFTLNSTNCALCTGNMSVGSIRAIDVNNTAVACDGGTLSDIFTRNNGFRADLTLSDRAASFVTSQSFDISTVTICRVSLSSPPDQVHGSATSSDLLFCFNYSVQNLGNIVDQYRWRFEFVQIEVLPDTPFLGFFNGTNCDAALLSATSGDFFFNISPNEIRNFSYRLNNTVNVTDVNFTTIISVSSQNCAGIEVRDTTEACNAADATPCTSD